jgi:predicted acetyltransferase
MMYAGWARTESEEDQAFELAVDAFKLPSTSRSSTEQRKKRLLADFPGFRDPSVVVVADASGQVVASCFIFPRTVLRLEAGIPAAFITNLVVRKSFRGRGLTNLLMDALISAAEDLGALMVLLIGRRAVDHLYTKFGFWGASEYHSISIKRSDLIVEEGGSARLRTAVPGDIEMCMAMYERSHMDGYGHCSRDRRYWQYCMDTADIYQLRWQVLEVDGKAVAYVISDASGHIQELAFLKVGLGKTLLGVFSAGVDAEAIYLQLSPHHPVLSEIAHADASFTVRNCRYGGHMVRLIDPDKLTALVQESKADNGKIKTVNSGFYSHEETLGAMGARMAGAQCSANCEGRLSFNIPLLDRI